MSDSPKNPPISRGRRHSIAVVGHVTSSPKSSFDQPAVETSFGRLQLSPGSIDEEQHQQRRSSLAPLVEQPRDRSGSGSGFVMQKPRRRSVVVIAPPSPPATNRSRNGSRRQSVTTMPSGGGGGDVGLGADQLIEAFVNEVDRAILNPNHDELPDCSNEFAAVMKEMMNGNDNLASEITVTVTPVS